MTDPDKTAPTVQMPINPPINPLLKSALEIGPILGFLAAYMWFKDETFALAGRDYSAFIAVTGLFVPVFLLTNGILWWLTGHISRMQAFTLVLLVVMGGLAVWFNDDRFVKLKPTVTYLVFAGILGTGLMFGKSFLRSLMEELTPLRDEGWMLLTRRLVIFFLAMAALNEVIWRLMSDDAFVFWDTVGQFVVTMGFFLSQAGLFTRYALEPDDKGDSAG